MTEIKKTETKEISLITAQEILKAEDVRYAYVSVDEWVKGKSIRLKSMSAKDATDWAGKGLTQAIVKSAVDENDNQLFTEEDVKVLGEKSFALLNRIQDACMVLNGMKGEAAKVLIKND